MKIVIIEDNEILANAIAYRLRDIGHGVDVLLRGDEADLFLFQENLDLVILDINLPVIGGLDILKNMRKRGNSAAVILLTARNNTQDRVIGLDLGADDYLVKPFEMEELEARIRALLRRKNQQYILYENLRGLTFNRGSRQVYIHDVKIDIPRREVAVLECLLNRQNCIVSKAQLIEFIYGTEGDVYDASIEPHISRLRKRLIGSGVQIKTARGLGYMIEVEDK